MHRSGTSALARGLRALAVDLGENFFDLKPDNSTGHWEDKTIVGINQRVLEELALTWDDTAAITRDRFRHHRIRLLALKAVRYLNETFVSRPLWGFKDPRTIRLLPFWVDALRNCSTDDAYVIAVRHPLSVAASLFRRREIQPVKAQRLWLMHNVPFLHELRGKPTIVVDYDLLVREPRVQLERVARRLGLHLDDASDREIDRFAANFLDAKLRHSLFSRGDFGDTTGELSRLTEHAYFLLHDLATDHREADDAFWSAWSRIQSRVSS
jgi:O-antigen biosynthesis protein